MIVFSGPTGRPEPFRSSPEPSMGVDQSSVNVPGGAIDTPMDELAQQPNVNLSLLANISTDKLCSLQKFLNSNGSHLHEWVWEMPSVNVSKVVEALGLDGYTAVSDVAVLPVWFKALMTVLFVGCLVWSVALNLRTLVAIGFAESYTNTLIGALAFSDLLTVTCTTPTEVSTVIHDLPVWDFGSFGCVTFPFLQSTAILSNALILCLIAHDRYVCVVKLKSFSINAKITWALAMGLATVWIMSIGISMPSFWLWRVYWLIVIDDVPDPAIGIDFCSVFPACMGNEDLSSSFFSNYHIALCGAIFIPLFILFAILYARIGYFLWLRSPVGTSGEAVGNQLARKKRVAWALFWLIFTFFICRMPNWIFVMVNMHTDASLTSGTRMLRTLLIFLSVLNTALNPSLYARLNEPMVLKLKNCSDHCCERLSIFSSCCQGPVLNDRPVSSNSDSERRTPDSQSRAKNRTARRHIGQIEPSDGAVVHATPENRNTDESNDNQVTVSIINDVVEYTNSRHNRSSDTSSTNWTSRP